jgi:hypothetical protein
MTAAKCWCVCGVLWVGTPPLHCYCQVCTALLLCCKGTNPPTLLLLLLLLLLLHATPRLPTSGSITSAHYMLHRSALTWWLVLHVHLACPLSEEARIRLAAVPIRAAKPLPRPKLITRIMLVAVEPCSSALRAHIQLDCAVPLCFLLVRIYQLLLVDRLAAVACDAARIPAAGVTGCAAAHHKG